MIFPNSSRVRQRASKFYRSKGLVGIDSNHQSQTEMRVNASRSPQLGQYYTSTAVGNLLVSSMHPSSPDTVLDLGAGPGVLGVTAANRWRNARVVSVEIDRLHRRCCSFTELIRADALSDNLPQKIGIPYGSLDAAVCNPPYVRLRWKKAYAELLERAGFSGLNVALSNVSADLLFLAQNLAFLRPGGQVGIIVPDGLIAGDRSRKLRQMLLEQHRLESVIELPHGTFVGTEAHAHILFISKGLRPRKHVKLFRFDGGGCLSSPLSIEIQDAEKRLDYSFFLHRRDISERSIQHSNTLESLGCSLKRGRIDSAELKRSSLPVFHTGDFPRGESRANFRIPKGLSLPSHLRDVETQVIAKAGDILISRVGRKLHEKVCFITQGRTIVSDCIYRLRVPKEHVFHVLEALMSPDGENYLSTAAHGAGAKYLCRQEVLNFQC